MLPQQRHVEADLHDVGRPGPVGQRVVVPGVVVVGRRAAALGLDHDDLVAVELHEIELATHAEGGGLEGDGAQRAVEDLGEGRVVVGLGLGRWRDALATAGPCRPLVLAAALDGVGRVDEVALHVLEVEEPLAVHELVAHPHGEEIGQLGGRRVTDAIGHDGDGRGAGGGAPPRAVDSASVEKSMGGGERSRRGGGILVARGSGSIAGAGGFRIFGAGTGRWAVAGRARERLAMTRGSERGRVGTSRGCSARRTPVLRAKRGIPGAIGGWDAV